MEIHLTLTDVIKMISEKLSEKDAKAMLELKYLEINTSPYADIIHERSNGRETKTKNLSTSEYHTTLKISPDNGSIIEVCITLDGEVYRGKQL